MISSCGIDHGLPWTVSPRLKASRRTENPCDGGEKKVFKNPQRSAMRGEKLRKGGSTTLVQYGLHLLAKQISYGVASFRRNERGR